MRLQRKFPIISPPKERGACQHASLTTSFLEKCHGANCCCVRRGRTQNKQQVLLDCGFPSGGGGGRGGGVETATGCSGILVFFTRMRKEAMRTYGRMCVVLSPVAASCIDRCTFICSAMKQPPLLKLRETNFYSSSSPACAACATCATWANLCVPWMDLWITITRNSSCFSGAP